MILSGTGDHGNRNIAHVVEGVWFINKVVVKELGCHMIGFGRFVGDISSFEGQGDSKEANKDGSLSLSSSRD